ncbi:MAG: quinone-dependent dihydroorotate dehydrogenase, partial [Betaproteobacteria bacterium]|nr:quinone-dependent dihydroorotate dehydrogenase [Betaproteobacteria bacterium]
MMPAGNYKLLRPLLFALPPETAHRAALAALRAGAVFAPPPPLLPVLAMGLRFPNPLGLAAGFDKNADSVDALAALGFGFIEVGGITPLPQSGNPHPRIFRLPEAHALINRMGFNNCGMEAAARNLLRRRRKDIVLGINLGKNAATPLADAAEDYCKTMETLYPHADFFTVNISSPNTGNLRELQQPEMLKKLLAAVSARRDLMAQKHGRRTPLAVKLSPDLDSATLAAAAEIIAAENIDGVIACNTTILRPPAVAALPAAAESGGLSGAPLAQRAAEMLRDLRNRLPEKTALIGVGGIMDGENARTRME